MTICGRGLLPISGRVRRVFLSPAWGRVWARTRIVSFYSSDIMAVTMATRGLHDSPWDLPWAAIASHGLPRHVPRVAIGHGAATARVMGTTMTLAVALATADHGSIMARAMATPMVCSAMACHGSQWKAMELPWAAMECHTIHSRMPWHCRGLAWARPRHCHAISHY